MAKTPITNRSEKKALAGALRAMFGKLEAKPVSDRLKSVVEQLDASERPAATNPVKKAG